MDLDEDLEEVADFLRLFEQLRSEPHTKLDEGFNPLWSIALLRTPLN